MRHLQCKVVLIQNLEVGRAQLIELCDELGVAKNGIRIVGWVVNNAEAELSVCGSPDGGNKNRDQGDGEQFFLHGVAPL